jgi:histidinol dehydrogenase
MQQMNWTALTPDQRNQALARPRARTVESLRLAVREIVEDVRARGWDGLCDQAQRIDGRVPERVGVAPFAEQARRRLDPTQLEAIETARRNIVTFHEGARPRDVEVETLPGLRVRKLWRPIDRIGLYIPGGEAPLFSTLLMLAIPATVAGVREMVLTTPPRPDGTLDPVLALAAELCGIEAVWTVGGAQAVAALAFGAGDIPAVAKICGPGNAWVNEAKAYVSNVPGGPAIDMPAGPSELLVIADASADPALVAADLLSQAEHDVSAQVLLVTDSAPLAERVEAELTEQLATLPRRTVAGQSLENARILLVGSLDEAAGVANAYAPEHLSLAVAEPAGLVDRIVNAGAIFAGHRAAETFGDYLGGSSHVLPTDGAARAWSGVSVDTFMKATTVLEVDEAAARALAGPAAALARLEGLEAHARAADLRGANAAARTEADTEIQA